MDKLVFTIVGKKGLLMNNPLGSMMAGIDINVAKTKTTKSTKGGVEVLSIADQAKVSRYVKDGKLYLPAEAVRKCIIIAARGYKVAGKRSSMADTVSASLIIFEPEFTLLNPKTGKALKETDYEIDVRRVVIPSTKSAVPRGRALVPSWACVCIFEFDTNKLASGDIKPMIEDAGRFPGLLDYRPAKSGWFGTFTLKDIEQRKE
jgi:hypothetical protein